MLQIERIVTMRALRRQAPDKPMFVAASGAVINLAAAVKNEVAALRERRARKHLNQFAWLRGTTAQRYDPRGHRGIPSSGLAVPLPHKIPTAIKTITATSSQKANLQSHIFVEGGSGRLGRLMVDIENSHTG